MGTVYPEVYFDEKEIDIISLQDALILSRGDLSRFDIYKLGWEQPSNKSVIDLYKKLYNV